MFQVLCSVISQPNKGSTVLTIFVVPKHLTILKTRSFNNKLHPNKFQKTSNNHVSKYKYSIIGIQLHFQIRF